MTGLGFCTTVGRDAFSGFPNKKLLWRARRESAAFRPHHDTEKSCAHFHAPHGDVKPCFVKYFAWERGCSGRPAQAEKTGARRGERSVVNGFGISSVVIREDLDIRGGGLVV